MIHDTSYNYNGTRTANSYGDGHIVICDINDNNEVINLFTIEG